MISDNDFNGRLFALSAIFPRFPLSIKVSKVPDFTPEKSLISILELAIAQYTYNPYFLNNKKRHFISHL